MKYMTTILASLALLVGSVVPGAIATEEISAEEQLGKLLSKGEHNEHDRDLQFGGGAGGGLAAICGIVDTLIPGDATCTCGIEFSAIGTIVVVFECAYQSPLCAGQFCSSPNLLGTVDPLSFQASAEICLLSNTNAGISLPNLCFNLGSAVVPERRHLREEEGSRELRLFNNDFGNRINNRVKNVRGKFKENSQEIRENLRSRLDMCSVTSNGRACNSCDVCDEGRGITFDCSNIHELYVQSECNPTSIVANLRPQNFQMIKFMPSFDE